MTDERKSVGLVQEEGGKHKESLRTAHQPHPQPAKNPADCDVVGAS